jgi:tetrapyrrole methylase family protein/MazG family protein
VTIDARAWMDALSQLNLDDDPSEGLLFLSGSGTDSLRLDARLPTVVSLPVSDVIREAIVSRYPHELPVKVAGGDSTRNGTVSSAFASDSPITSGFVYLSPLTWEQDLRDFRTLIEVVARLRAPDGCPWDRAQTHKTLAPYLLEETYEALEEVDNERLPALKEELGDVLLQVGLHSQIADEAGAFSVADVIEGLLSKLIRRHPHVFDDATANSVADVNARWEVLKSRERDNASLMIGVPVAMPALGYAQRVQERAASIGFDWPSIDGALGKVVEEATEFAAADGVSEREDEFGDILFSLVNLGRHSKIDVEMALRGANRRFVSRFRKMEELARMGGAFFADLPLDEQDRLWNLAKEQGE